MFTIVALESVKKSAKIMLLLVIFLMIMCGNLVSAVKHIPSAETSHILNPSHPDSQSGSLKSQEQKGSNIFHNESPSSDATTNKVGSSVVNVSKSDCKTEPCSHISSNQDSLKVPAHNASLHVSNQSESVVHPDDPGNEMMKKLNPEALMRGFYVFAALSVIVIVYIAWKSFGKRPTQVHRYGVLANREDLEMAPLDSDDGEADNDDTTHFDISKHRLK